MPNLNGHLYGRPEFVLDGQRRGFVFDGKTQYAEASPMLADLGQVTVDIALKWEGGTNQVIFDFGTSKENRFILNPAGPSGRAELAITRAGKTERVIADTALPKGKWARCRAEIDGKRIAIWVDGRKAADKASGFRPADVFPAGAEKRNFIAASRDATSHFKGGLDYLRVYYAVYDDFTKAPSPRRHASRKITREFIDTCSTLYAGVNERREKLIRQKVEPKLGFYSQLGKRKDELLGEIEAGAAKATAEEGRKLAEIRKEFDKRTAELRAEFDKLPETIAKRQAAQKLEAKARELDKQRAEAIKAIETAYRARNKAAIEEEARRRKAGIKPPKGEKTHQQRIHDLVREDPRITSLAGEIDTCRKQARELRPDPRSYIDQRTVALRGRLTKAEVDLREARKRHIAKHKLEHDWLSSLQWLVFSGHYNYNYRRYFYEQISRTIGGKVCHENFGSLGSLMNAQKRENWRTKCDWDWRLKQEADRSIANLPLLRKWVQRARGPVVTEEPSSAK